MYDVVVVGAGPAGLAASRRAAESGARVALLDDNPTRGGQIWRSGVSAPWVNEQVEWIPGARVFAAPAAGTLAVETLREEREVRYRALILATGARELFLPFPGWTLPNVMGAGGLQALVKSGLPIAGKRVIVAGSGPLLLAVADYLRRQGAEVRLIAEQADAKFVYGFAMQLGVRRMWQAMTLRPRAPYLTACWVVAAHGKDKVERVTLRRREKTWNVDCDYLACGFGLVPNLELPCLMGCAPGERGVRVDEFQQTSVKDVYAAGEVTGIGGLDLSLVEGEIAGYTAAGRHNEARRLFGARVSHAKFATALENAFALREELKALPEDETLVCRCEDVSYARVRRYAGWREAKLQTRCGMGSCQGRVCGAALEFLLDWKAGPVRPPVFPARIEGLLRGHSSTTER